MIGTPELFVTNFHRRFTGVSATADAVVSQQNGRFNMKLVGDPLPSGPQPLSYRQAVALSRRAPIDHPFAIWHVRRNQEMMAAIVARDVLRLPIRIVFTSAAQRYHSYVPRAMIAKMDAVVATTQKAANYVPHVADVIPHGVDTLRFEPAEDRSIAWRSLNLPGDHGIGIVGRIRPEKGTDRFVDAMCRLLPQRPGFTAVMLGRVMPSDQEFQKQLQRRIADVGLEDRIVFMGEQPSSKIPQWMRSLSLLVAPARYEGYGMTPLEAMASGVAVVATDTGVYRSILQDGETGYVVDLDDQVALEEALFAITADPDQLLRMGQTARRYATEHLSLQAETDGYSRIYQELWQGQTFE
ncbi:glycosyltransferase family 4 protein [Neorhodopirellula pilleata]|nr:glycosyltransferase family 4 protein [Neorhodopirellula pilleata]